MFQKQYETEPFVQKVLLHEEIQKAPECSNIMDTLQILGCRLFQRAGAFYL